MLIDFVSELNSNIPPNTIATSCFLTVTILVPGTSQKPQNSEKTTELVKKKKMEIEIHFNFLLNAGFLVKKKTPMHRINQKNGLSKNNNALDRIKNMYKIKGNDLIWMG